MVHTVLMPSTPGGAPFVRGWLLAFVAWLLALSPVLTGAVRDSRKDFDIPAGDAAESLRRFSEQAGTQVIFLEKAIEGAQTRALKGAFTPVEAIGRLLAGTGLRAAHDRESGAFAVSRVPRPPEETDRPND